MIDEETKQRILAAAPLEAALEKYCGRAPGWRERKRVYTCPLCGKPMQYHPGKDLVKCFHCDWGASNALKLLMDKERLSFPDALRRLAADFGVDLPDNPQPARAAAKPKSWCARQLEASGLSPRDVRATVQLDSADIGLVLNLPDGVKLPPVPGPVSFTASPFFSGTVDERGRVSRTGDDMIIQYFDLDGRPVTYQPRADGRRADSAAAPRPFYRVRWQFPESHLTRSGDSPKYLSPAGSGVHLYIPERVRQAYAKAEQVPALFFTEGEKKAEAVCRHVGPAFGMGGIQCLTGRDSRALPSEVIRFIDRCGVRRIYFIMDSDWNALGSRLTPDTDVQSRPKAFARAAITFRDWFLTLANRQLYLDIYLILGREGRGKGVDDTLMLLRPDESRYARLVEQGTADAAAGGDTDLFRVVKISSAPDGKIRELWSLDDPARFAAAHLDELRALTGGFLLMRNLQHITDDGQLESVYGLMDDETFWTVTERADRAGNTTTAYSYNYERALRFLDRRGYHKMKTDAGDWTLVRVDGQEITEVSEVDIQDNVMEFVRGYQREGTDKEGILNMLHRAKAQYLGRYQLTSLFEHKPDYPQPERDSQVLLFRSRYWRVTADGIEEHPIASAPFNYWRKDLREADPVRLRTPLVQLDAADGNLSLSFSPDAMSCDFLRFLMLTSWFDWDKALDSSRRPIAPGGDAPPPEQYTAQLLAKLTAIGYLLHQYNNPAVAKAVIAMDEHISPAGQSNGRSGKSLISMALRQMTNVVELPGKGLDLTGDRFVFSQVTSQTRVITLDDIEPNFNFELLFPAITSGLTVNEKGQKRFTLSGHDKPKFFITTNHTLIGTNGSARDRQFKIAFSNFFDETYKPERLFGRLFFDDWDTAQWNLFYNLMADCLQIYFLAQRNRWGVSGSGLIEAPCEALDKRQLRQMMTEGFYQWAVDYFGINEADPADTRGTRLNERIERLEMYNSYLCTLSQAEIKFVKPPKFRDRLIYFCRYFGYLLNPQMPHDALGAPLKYDKSGGLEYYTVGPAPLGQ